MTREEYAQRVETVMPKLYRMALSYLRDETLAADVVSEAVYKGLRSHKKLRQPEYFDTWMGRIVINLCHDETKRRSRLVSLEALPETAQPEDFDALSLREAVERLPKALKDVVICRYFGGYTLAETAQALDIPLGTAATRQRRALELLRLDLKEEEL
jgi:RNA polymerase sigma-70 factor (ECF subfamily)